MSCVSTIVHVQRRVFLTPGKDGSEETAAGQTPSAREDVDGSILGGILFQAIAGDATGKTLAAPEEATMQGLQFGMLDAAGVSRLAVATVTTSACTEQPGCLADLRMGASAITGRLCETCHNDNHTPAVLCFFSRIHATTQQQGGRQPIVRDTLVGSCCHTPC